MHIMAQPLSRMLGAAASNGVSLLRPTSIALGLFVPPNPTRWFNIEKTQVGLRILSNPLLRIAMGMSAAAKGLSVADLTFLNIRPRKKASRPDRCRTGKQYNNKRHVKGYYYRWLGS
eukprot:GDKI01020936.1.p1 GENE.GDKI01020936.1~~GDKI01020936.1.p1  ORF type:complete len:117 (+),score=7.23 GDKI01020936.1:70-420(+)